MGPISDRYGRKPMIIFSLIGSSVGSIHCVVVRSRSHCTGFVD